MASLGYKVAIYMYVLSLTIDNIILRNRDKIFPHSAMYA